VLEKICWNDHGKNEVLQRVRRKKHPTSNKKNEGTLHWLHLVQNCPLSHNIEGKIEERTEVTEDKEEEISSYWTVLMKQNARNLKRKH
jgi:hypothetical protein